MIERKYIFEMDEHTKDGMKKLRHEAIRKAVEEDLRRIGSSKTDGCGLVVFLAGALYGVAAGIVIAFAIGMRFPL